MRSAAAARFACPDRRHPALQDCCTNCLRLSTPLVVALDAEHDAVIGAYRCSRCGSAWWTSYAPEVFA